MTDNYREVWGHANPPVWKTPKDHDFMFYVSGFIKVFILIPLVIIGLLVLLALLLVAIAVPPVGVAMVAAASGAN